MSAFHAICSFLPACRTLVIMAAAAVFLEQLDAATAFACPSGRAPSAIYRHDPPSPIARKSLPHLVDRCGTHHNNWHISLCGRLENLGAQLSLLPSVMGLVISFCNKGPRNLEVSHKSPSSVGASSLPIQEIRCASRLRSAAVVERRDQGGTTVLPFLLFQHSVEIQLICFHEEGIKSACDVDTPFSSFSLKKRKHERPEMSKAPSRLQQYYIYGQTGENTF